MSAMQPPASEQYRDSLKWPQYRKPTHEEWNAEVIALRTELAAIKAAQPDGWLRMPKEPTPEMWDAAWNSIGLPYRAKLSMHEIKTLFEKFHEAMLAAAPKEAK